jgi:DNA/RNA endonuclease YhcR with UshA esterase domain
MRNRLAKRVFAAVVAVLWCASAGAQPQFVNIGTLSTGSVGQDVYLQGRIVNHREPWNERAPHLLTITDGTGEIDVVFWDPTYVQIANREAYTPGAVVQAFTKVDEHRGKLQAKLADPSHIRLVGGMAPAGGGQPAAGGAAPGMVSGAPATPGAKAAAIGNINTSMTGQLVVVRGAAAQVRPPNQGTRAPFKVTLEDSTGSISVVYWENLDAQLNPADRPSEGKVYEITGEVGEYRGELQLQPKQAGDIKLARQGAPAGGEMAAPAMGGSMPPPPGVSDFGGAAATDPFGGGGPMGNAPPPGVTGGGSFGQAPPSPAFGQSAPAFGGSEPASPFGGTPPPSFGGSQPVDMASTPATFGSQPVDMGSQPVDMSSTPATFGSQPASFGSQPVDMGSQPVDMGSTPVVSMSQPPAAAVVTPIGSIKNTDKDAEFTVAGTVDKVISSSYGLLLTVTDNTGSISVYMAAELAERSPHASQIQKGWKVKVTGKVQLYKNTPELRPTKSNDLLEARP